MCRPFLIPLLALSLSATSMASSEDPLPADQPDLEFEGLIEVSEVLLDVVATDAQGRPVTGLDSGDFIVVENGEAVQLTGVSYYTTRYGGQVADAEEVPSSRYFIMFFDNRWQRSFHAGDLKRQQRRAGDESRRWFEEEMLASDWVAVVSYGSDLRVHQDFTQDRDALASAVLNAAAGRPPGDPQLRRRTSRSSELSVLRRMPRGPELRRDTRTVYGALEAVAVACAPVVGRKNLLMFTTGIGDDWRFGKDGTDVDFYPSTEIALNDHNVAVYPIDLSPTGRGTRQTSFLTRLAEDTGGAYHERDFYGYMSSLRDIGGDNYAYYVLSYQSQHPAGEIGYQRVEVKARDESIQVRARKGYRYGL